MVGVCILEMQIIDSYSLKDKRRVLKSLIQRIRQRFNASVSENKYHDSWQRTELEIAVTSRTKSGAEKVLQEILKFAEIDGRAEIIKHFIQYV